METPAHREVELQEPEAPKAPKAPKALEAPEGEQVPAGGQPPVGLREVYRQGEALDMRLRKQNIIQVADGSYLQARPDGVGGVELVPVARALQKRD